ncbi:hypothetical protein PV726_17145 [Streptomyces europaeiscabiei]|uniref:hypothetical protein n=1 Tax=Streptomyces europaeiscabiei TaxID=146819 RepID=UPI0029BBB808|nr:hypothetical protein [Streptomyces europaeiscabiei]MDX3692038.1 hypothetical protein [Streptomyces europaeiscabiei]
MSTAPMTWSGYFFEGELLLLDLESGTTTSLKTGTLAVPQGFAQLRPAGSSRTAVLPVYERVPS